MSIKLHTAPLIGESQVSGGTWQQAYFQHNYGVILKLKSTPTPQTQHQLINKLNNNLLSKTQTTSLQESVVELLAPIKEQIQTVAVVSVKDDNISIYARKTTVLLARNGQIIELLKETGETKGKLQPGDKLALIDTIGLEFLGKIRFQELLINSNNIDEMVDELQLTLHKANSTSTVIGLLLQAERSQINTFPERASHSRNVKSEGRRLKRLIRHHPIKTMAFIIGAVVLILLVRWIDRPSVSSNQVSTSITAAKYKLEEGTALLELNRLRSRKVLTEGEQKLTELMLKLNKRNTEYKQASKLLQQIREAQSLATAAYKIEPKPFFELSLLRDKLTGDELDLAGSKYIFIVPVIS